MISDSSHKKSETNEALIVPFFLGQLSPMGFCDLSKIDFLDTLLKNWNNKQHSGCCWKPNSMPFCHDNFLYTNPNSVEVCGWYFARYA